MYALFKLLDLTFNAPLFIFFDFIARRSINNILLSTYQEFVFINIIVCFIFKLKSLILFLSFTVVGLILSLDPLLNVKLS